MTGDIRDDWKIRDIERTANEAHRRLYELDSLNRKMDSLEHSNREISTEVNGLRSEIQTLQGEIVFLKEKLLEINPNLF